MKAFFIFLFCFVLATSACNKKEDDCTLVTITNSAPGCGGWGIVVNGTKYPSRNIPSEFQQNNIAVCVSYELYEDAGACACCGGTWANIKSIEAAN